MIRGGLLLALTIASLALAASTAQALGYPHNSSFLIDCANCHAAHTAVILPRGLEQETLCRSCHNPTSVGHFLANVGQHVVAGGTIALDCGTCHGVHAAETVTDPHDGTTAPNRSLIRGDPSRYYPGATAPLVFHARPADFARGETDAPWTGACQVCHQQTQHHTADASADHQHMIGGDCLACHPHEDGFAPLYCADCHNQPVDNGDGIPVGGRRAVIGEFPADSTHGHLAQLPETYAGCVVCHDLTTHGNGQIELKQADSGTLISFVDADELSGDPDLSNFCMSCHDADGAQAATDPIDPFGTGNAPTDVATRFMGNLQWREWYGDFCFGAEGTMRPVNSHHDISDADQAFSGGKVECLDCHGSHSSADTQRLADPWGAPGQVWNGTMADFCLSCHAGGTDPTNPPMPPGVVAPMITVDAAGQPCDGPLADCSTGSSSVVGLSPLQSCTYWGTAPWWVSYTWHQSAHGLNSKRPWSGYSGAPSYDMDCTACHDAHGSYTPTNPAGNPYAIRDYVRGDLFIDDGSPTGTSFGPPWDTTGVSQEVVVSVTPGANPPPAGSDYAVVDWGNLCASCHADWLNAYSWHSFCNACQTCHGHGSDWMENDWGVGGADTGCFDCGDGVVASPVEGCEPASLCEDGTTPCSSPADCVGMGTESCGTANDPGCSAECLLE